jgi:IS5 family transposase
MEYQLLDRMSCKRFCALGNAGNIPDRATVWVFEKRIGQARANLAMTMMAACRNLKRLVYFQEAGIKAL